MTDSPMHSDLGPGKYILLDTAEVLGNHFHVFDAENEADVVEQVNKFMRESMHEAEGEPERLGLVLIGPYSGRLQDMTAALVRELWVVENKPTPRFSVRYPERKS